MTYEPQGHPSISRWFNVVLVYFQQHAEDAKITISKVEVCYFPKDPKKAILIRCTEKFSAMIWLGIFGVVLGILLFIVRNAMNLLTG